MSGASSLLAGDAARQRARRAAWLALFALPVSIWLFARLGDIWARIAPLEGAAFMLGATALGGALAVAPVITVVAFLVSVWYGAESVFLPRQRPTPLVDRGLTALGILVWFSPALALVGSVLKAIVTGTVSFARPARVYNLATDPLAFWEGVGFLLIAAGALAFPAWHYWRNKFRKAVQAQTAATPDAQH